MPSGYPRAPLRTGPPASELIRRRYSCRIYRPEPIAAAQQRLLTGLMAASAVGPLRKQAVLFRAQQHSTTLEIEL